MFSFTEPVVLLGGGACSRSMLSSLMQRHYPLVVADGGASHLDVQNLESRSPEGQSLDGVSIVPDLIIGDLDSLENRRRWQSVTRVVEIEEQDTTDFEKCLYTVDAPRYLALGFSGKRLDHTLAALHVAAKYQTSKQVLLIGTDDVVFMCRGAQQFQLRRGVRFSIFPLEPVSFIESTGLKYSLNGLSLSPTTMIGTSNEVTDDLVTLDTEPGSVGAYAVILPVNLLGMMLDRQ